MAQPPLECLGAGSTARSTDEADGADASETERWRRLPRRDRRSPRRGWLGRGSLGLAALFVALLPDGERARTDAKEVSLKEPDDAPLPTEGDVPVAIHTDR